MYGLTKTERNEVNDLERELFYSNGIPKKEVLIENPEKGNRLKQLYNKKKELILASMN